MITKRLSKPKIDLIGKQFGVLLVIRKATSDLTPSDQSKTVWLCECVCGTRLRVWAQALVQGNSTSCGCKGKNRPIGIKEHTSWRAMMQRCYSPTFLKYCNYGARGIVVDQRWHTFEYFLEDMGYAPSKRHTLDRYPDIRGNYEPSNVRWATPKQQARNKIAWPSSTKRS